MRVVATLTLLWLTPISASALDQVEPPVIESLRGYSFDVKTGRLSDVDMLSSDDRGRWNDTTSDAIFVVVEIVGKPLRVFDGKSSPTYHIRLIATDLKKSKRLTTMVRPVRRLSEDGTFFVGFLVYIDPCSPVRVVVTLEGRRAASKFESVAAFACGE
jgi:hypothetical protein